VYQECNRSLLLTVRLADTATQQEAKKSTMTRRIINGRRDQVVKEK